MAGQQQFNNLSFNRVASSTSTTSLGVNTDRALDQIVSAVNPVIQQAQKMSINCAAGAAGAVSLGTSNALTVTTTEQIINFANKLYDTDNAFDLTAGFTVPVNKSGTYIISASVQVSGTVASSWLLLQVITVTNNNQNAATMSARCDTQVNGGHTTLAMTSARQLTAGTNITLQIVSSSNTGLTLQSGNDNTYLTLVRIPGL